MFGTTGTSTSLTDSSSKPPPNSPLSRLLGSKKLPALFFGVLLILCFVLLLAVLVYVLVSFAGKGHAVASPPSVTADEDADVGDHGGEGAAQNGSADTATATNGAMSRVAARERRHTDTLRAVSASVSSLAGDSTGYTTGLPHSDTSMDAAIGTNGHDTAAIINANQSSAGDIAMVEALFDLEASSETARLPDQFEKNARTANFTNNRPADIASPAAWQDDFVVFGGQQETMPNLETPAYSNGNISEVTGRHASAKEYVGIAENITPSKYTAASDVTTNCNSSASAMSNASEPKHFIKNGTKRLYTALES